MTSFLTSCTLLIIFYKAKSNNFVLYYKLQIWFFSDTYQTNKNGQNKSLHQSQCMLLSKEVAVYNTCHYPVPVYSQLIISPKFLRFLLVLLNGLYVFFLIVVVFSKYHPYIGNNLLHVIQYCTNKKELPSKFLRDKGAAMESTSTLKKCLFYR